MFTSVFTALTNRRQAPCIGALLPLTACGVLRRMYMNDDLPDASKVVHDYSIFLWQTHPRYSSFLSMERLSCSHAVVVRSTSIEQQKRLVESAGS